MAEFFFFLAILLECGIFPMGWSDCGPRSRPPITMQAPERVEAP